MYGCKGVEVEEAGMRRGKIISMAMCATGDCLGALVTSFGPALDAGVPRLSEENSSLWHSLGNYSWTC